MSDIENGSPESQAYGISLRGWLALIITLTVCLMSAYGLEVPDSLVTMNGMILVYYFKDRQK